MVIQTMWAPLVVNWFGNPMNPKVISTIKHRIQPLISQLNTILGAPHCKCPDFPLFGEKTIYSILILRNSLMYSSCFKSTPFCPNTEHACFCQPLVCLALLVGGLHFWGFRRLHHSHCAWVSFFQPVILKIIFIQAKRPANPMLVEVAVANLYWSKKN